MDLYGNKKTDLGRQFDAMKTLTPTEALQAIIARINGEWDRPALKLFGPLHIDSEVDILEIARQGLRPEPEASDSGGLWERDDIQFPRLLCEIVATQSFDFEDLAMEMDLEVGDIYDLFDRADIAWQAVKRGLIPAAKIPDTDENWENGRLGCDERFARVATPEEEARVEAALHDGGGEEILMHGARPKRDWLKGMASEMAKLLTLHLMAWEREDELILDNHASLRQDTRELLQRLAVGP